MAKKKIKKKVTKKKSSKVKPTGVKKNRVVKKAKEKLKISSDHALAYEIDPVKEMFDPGDEEINDDNYDGPMQTHSSDNDFPELEDEF